MCGGHTGRLPFSARERSYSGLEPQLVGEKTEEVAELSR